MRTDIPFNWLSCMALSAGCVFANAALPAHAQTYTETLLHSFSGSDGKTPYGGVILDGKGNLFGTTVNGGGSNAGTIFEIAADGIFRTLYSFSGGNDGANPYGGPVKIGDALYGTTRNGGTLLKGTIFKLTLKTGQLTTLHSFDWFDGVYPMAPLLADKSGNLFGVTTHGGGDTDQCFGSQGCGVVFEYATDGTYRVIHSFLSGDGAYPAAGLITDSVGNLYGSTEFGPNNNGGVAYVVTPDGDTTMLCGAPYPAVGGLTLDPRGNLFGSLNSGGGTGCNGTGCGALFEVTSAGGCGAVYSFTSVKTGTNPSASMVLNRGVFYGTTSGSGAKANAGTVFAFTPSTRRKPAVMTVLHYFTPATGDGGTPGGGTLWRDHNGNFFGTTQRGGANDAGTVYELSPVAEKAR